MAIRVAINGFGRIGRLVLRAILGIQATCAVIGIVGAVLGARLYKLNAFNNIVTLVTLISGLSLLVLIHFTVKPSVPFNRDMRVFVGGLMFWFIFILQANLSGLQVFRGLGHEYEFVGFLVFVVVMFHLDRDSGARTFAGEFDTAIVCWAYPLSFYLLST